MASIRKRSRADGSTGYAVLYTLDGQQTSATFDTEADAERFRDTVNSLGAEMAMRAWRIEPTKPAQKRHQGPTVQEYLEHHVEHLTGITKTCRYDYNSYIRRDIAPFLGAVPLTELTRDHVARWLQNLEEPAPGGRKPAAKTIANKYGFLAGALNEAVRKNVIAANPCTGIRLPRSERPDMVFLTSEEFAVFLSCFTERWRPLVRFMVVSGARFGEISALRPADVDRTAGTVRIARAWKRTYEKGGYELGPTKTKRSDRVINIDTAMLTELDYSGEWLFTNSRGKPIRVVSFRSNVWYPALAKAKDAGLAKRPRIHDMRHTCASWMIGLGIPLPVIQGHLGHESISTTVNLYGHLDRRTSQAAAAGIAGMLPRELPDPGDTP